MNNIQLIETEQFLLFHIFQFIYVTLAVVMISVMSKWLCLIYFECDFIYFGEFPYFRMFYD